MRGLKPRDLFILRYGVLGYGGGLFVVFNTLHLIRLRAHGYSLAGITVWFLITAMISLTLGYLFGIIVWKRMQKRRKPSASPR